MFSGAVMSINPALRNCGIAGSDAGAVLGVDESRDGFAVWAEKKGALPPQPPTVRMIVGKALETGILNLYTYVTGREVEYCDQTRQHPERPWQVGTPDAFCKHERRGVDAKLVFFDQRWKWGTTADDIPARVQCQAWWYMALCDIDVWDIAALVGDGLPRIYTIERDREAERVMLARAEEWWHRFIEGDERPPIGTGPAAHAWLARTFPQHKRPDLRAATGEEILALEEYAQVRLEQKAIKEERECLENRLKAAVGEREGLEWSGGKFTWRKTKDKEVTDWQSMARGLLNTYVEVGPVRNDLLTFYTRSKPGTRRIWFNSDLFTEEEAEGAA